MSTKLHNGYLPRRLRFSVAWSEAERKYVARCPDFPFSRWLAPTKQEALDALRMDVERHDMRDNGEPNSNE